MKKILSLLSVLTITGTTIPNVIAAGNYQKIQHKIEKNRNSDINHKQTNYLETLIRNKRTINSKKNSI